MAGLPPAPPAEIRILALGDSYTIGESVPATARWPERLAAMLRARGVAAAEPVVVAKTGWTTDELSAGIDAAHPTGRFELVTLLIGVNNQYRGRSADEYRNEFRALLTRAVGFAGGSAAHVIVVSIPDWGVTPFARERDASKIAGEIDSYNAINRDEAKRAGAHWVDVTPSTRRAASDPSLIAGDGLHPSAKAYEEWASMMLPTALQVLQSR